MSRAVGTSNKCDLGETEYKTFLAVSDTMQLMIQQLRNLMTEVFGESTEVSKVVCSKPKTCDEVSIQVSTSTEVSKEDTEVCLIECWCRSYQGCS